jgi:hypothetical protein
VATAFLSFAAIATFTGASGLTALAAPAANAAAASHRRRVQNQRASHGDRISIARDICHRTSRRDHVKARHRLRLTAPTGSHFLPTRITSPSRWLASSASSAVNYHAVRHAMRAER